MQPLRVLDLFSGIGGFSLGLESTGGFVTTGFCEIVPHACRVIAKHWPGVAIFDDVTTIAGGGYDVVCGGFPCQDISLAGAGAGIEGARSGLWFEMLRIIGATRPRWAIIENVAALRGRGLDQVLGGLAAIGYDAEWHCIPASAVGAPHRRDRLWIVAYPNGQPEQQPALGVPPALLRDGDARVDAGGRGELLADAPVPRLEISLQGEPGEQPAVVGACPWTAEPAVGRVAYGVPSRVDRITRLGNAVVPQIPARIGAAILRWERRALEPQHS